jgi:hypothetical protein
MDMTALTVQGTTSLENRSLATTWFVTPPTVLGFPQSDQRSRNKFTSRGHKQSKKKEVKSSAQSYPMEKASTHVFLSSEIRCRIFADVPTRVTISGSLRKGNLIMLE